MRSLQNKFSAGWHFKFTALFATAVVAGIVLSTSLSSAQLPRRQIPLAGGEATVFDRTSHGLEQPASNLIAAELALHTEGDRNFGAVFVSPPAPVNAGLGPTFNNSSCTACHLRDGRGMPVKGNLLLQVSMPMSHPVANSQPISAGGTNKHTSSLFEPHPEASVTLGRRPPVPGIGTQIQDQAIYGYKPKATVEISWQEKTGTYRDGTMYGLRSPQFKVTLPDDKPLPKEVLISPRLPPPVPGRGLLEAIPEQTILALADPEDKNKDGISGHPNHVWDVRKKALVLGRFGLKANHPNLLQQNATAYVNDMGVTNPLFPEKDGSSDIDAQTLKLTTFYTQTIGVPARTLLDDPEVQRGEKLFAQANCAACHAAELQTGNHEIKAISYQTIHPYTDMLLHDMGAGLADGRPDFEASGTEWRTPPLWGLGLTQAVLPHSGYLHDGRARTIAEAILWHGGEAEGSKDLFQTMAKGDREAMLRFLNSL